MHTSIDLGAVVHNSDKAGTTQRPPPWMNGQTKRGLTPTTEYYSALRIRRTSRISCQVKKERTQTVAYHRDPFAKCPQELNPQDGTQIHDCQGLGKGRGLRQKVLDFPLGRRTSSGTGSWPPLHITVRVQSTAKVPHAPPCPRGRVASPETLLISKGQR